MTANVPVGNANGQRFWMLSQLADWLPQWRSGSVYLAGQGLVDPNGNLQTVQTAGVSNAEPPVWNTTAGQTTTDAGVTWLNRGADTSQSGLSYCNASRRLQLRSVRTGAAPAEDFAVATALLNAVPETLDLYGNYARWDASNAVVVAGGSGPSDAPEPNEVPIYRPPVAQVTDLAMGYDGILYLAVGGSLILVDQRMRWPPYTLAVADFHFWRLMSLPTGGTMALDSDGAQLAVVAGEPLPDAIADAAAAGVMQPCQANANPPRIITRRTLPTGEYYVALAPLDVTQRPLRTALLSWGANAADNTAAYLRVFEGTTVVSPRLTLGGVRLPFSICGLGAQKLAVFATNLNEALVYSLENVDLALTDAAETLMAVGETYVLSGTNVGPVAHGFDLPPRYAAAPGMPPLQSLIPLSLNSMATQGATNPAAPAIIDSGIARNVWHRLFVEAVMPPRTGALIWLSASDTQQDLARTDWLWYPHALGDAALGAVPAPLLADVPRVVWQSIATEVPGAPMLLTGTTPASDDRTRGLFMALVQRANKSVRSLSGRFLGVRIQLTADGRNTPEIAGMRIYGPRFSYVQNYLPQIYHEDQFGADADTDLPSTRRDFFERFVNLFEDQLTRIEDQVANAYLLTRADSTPETALPWLGGWLGTDDAGYPPDRRRARLEATPQLYRQRGTAGGITRALDVATDGMCRRGAILVIEDFRLRHTFATILGADLATRDDPLLPGYSGSSNSLVGDTLFLGDPSMQAELQALYAVQLGIGDAQSVQAFYDQLALQLTVFVHDQVENVNLNLVQRIVEAEKPAHVRAVVRRATTPFLVGLASLLGVDTYLGPQPIRQGAALDVSEIGRYDVIRQLPSLDPRLENGRE